MSFKLITSMPIRILFLMAFSHADEGKLQAVRLSHQIRDARIDILETCSTSH
jgi:hypothetical protein